MRHAAKECLIEIVLHVLHMTQDRSAQGFHPQHDPCGTHAAPCCTCTSENHVQHTAAYPMRHMFPFSHNDLQRSAAWLLSDHQHFCHRVGQNLGVRHQLRRVLPSRQNTHPAMHFSAFSAAVRRASYFFRAVVGPPVVSWRRVAWSVFSFTQCSIIRSRWHRRRSPTPVPPSGRSR